MSSTEAEFQAMTQSNGELMWLRLIVELNIGGEEM